MRSNWLFPCVIAIAVMMTGCSSNPPRLDPSATDQGAATPGFDFSFFGLWPKRKPLTERERYEALAARPPAGARAVKFDLSSQTFEYVEDGEVILSGPIASGTPKSPTPTGRYSVLSKQKDKVSSRYENEVGTPALMPFSLQFYGHYFVHEGWLPGYPASHGCIRLGHHDARLLFERMQIGDPVTVEL